MQNSVFRASYSTLSTWAAGNFDLAMERYFKINRTTTPEMEFGRNWHKRVEKEIQSTKCLPTVFGGKKLIAPKTELKIELRLENWLDLVGIIDLYDDGVIYDWKTGMTSSEQWASTMQPLVYQLLMPKAERFEIHRYNQYSDEVDMSVGHLTLGTAQKAYDWVIQNSIDMYDYIENYGKSYVRGS